jgi:hypothetical protein
MERQLMSQWCWSAVSVSIDTFYNGATRLQQCQLAALVTELTCCTAGCNQPNYLERALRIVGRFRMMQTRPATALELEREYAALRVTGVLVRWRGGGGHFLAIVGVQGSPQGAMVYVDDPRTGSSHSMLADRLRSGYKGSGDWTATYFTEP